MTLRKKTLLVVGTTLVALVSILYATSRRILLESFAESEERRAKVNVERVLEAISAERSALERLASEWSAWDQMYAFMEHQNSGFISNVVTAESLQRMLLSVMLIVDSSGQVVFGKAMNLRTGEETSLPSELVAAISAPLMPMQVKDTQETLHGLVAAKDGPMLVVSRPILTSYGEGPSRGTVYVGRMMDALELKRIGGRLGLRLSISPGPSECLSGVAGAVFQDTLADDKIFVQSNPGESMWGMVWLKDYRAQPLALLRVHDQGNPYVRAKIATRYLVLSVGGIGLLFGILALLLIERLVLSRVANLSEGILQIGASGLTEGRVPVEGTDELAGLARSINEMLDVADRSNHKLRRSIAERLRTEEELMRAKEAAESADRAKSEFLANMSHEIRTPMTAILGFAENLLEPDLSESQKVAAISTIRRNGEHLLQIINDILDLSKIEAGKLEVERIVYSPFKLANEVESLMRVRAEIKGLSFNIEYMGAIPESIRTDPTRLRQILLNLIGNAIKFTDTGGVRLVIRLLREPDGASGEGGPMMQFDVLDTGIGMSPEQIENLFQPFIQADCTITRRFGGTGLGLTITRRLAELLGGKITVESEPGKGSAFRVVVPTGSLEGVVLHESSPIESPGGVVSGSSRIEHTLSGRILLAEDGMDNQRLISFVLKKAGLSITTVDNGQEAVTEALSARAKGTPYDLILMDMQMPVLDGYGATSLLRRHGYAGAIVALTAHAMVSEREKCLKAGCDDYATKPIERQKLLLLVSRYTKPQGVSSDMAKGDPPVGNGTHAASAVESFLGQLQSKVDAIRRGVELCDLGLVVSLAEDLNSSASAHRLDAIAGLTRHVADAARAHDDLKSLREYLEELTVLSRVTPQPDSVRV